MTSVFVICVSEWKSINKEQVPNLVIRILLGYAVVTNKPLKSQRLTHKGLFLAHVSSILVGQPPPPAHLVDLPTKTRGLQGTRAHQLLTTTTPE